MDFNLDKFLKRYVWDEEKTPYFTPAARLNRRQAAYESIAYAVFMCVLFAAVGLVSITGYASAPRAPGVALFSFTMIAAGVIFGFMRSYYASLWLSSAPAAAIGWLLIFGFKPKWATIDQVVILGFIGLWVLYSIRIVAIGRHYEDMPEPPAKS